MGKKGKWLSAVKNVFRSSSKDSAQVKENLTPVSKEKNESESEEVWVMLFMSVQMYGDITRVCLCIHLCMYIMYVDADLSHAGRLFLCISVNKSVHIYYLCLFECMNLCLYSMYVFMWHC